MPRPTNELPPNITWAPLAELPTGSTFRLELAPCPAPSREPKRTDIRVWSTTGPGEDAADDAVAVIREIYRAAGTPSRGQWDLERTADALYSVTYIGAHRLWRRELSFDNTAVRRVRELAATNTEDSSVKTWLTNDEEGTWSRKCRDLLEVVLRNPQSDQLTEQQIEKAIADQIALLALEAAVRQRTNPWINLDSHKD